ncbi:MAG: type II toxin-antitoxin system VapC family toxin [Spirochaetales bacterium]|nr:type II toxin-antitoxin system VapC family toxin [Spirochaetales bacterium]
MNLLLDTHIILWWLDDDPLLSEKYRQAVSDTENVCLVSAASIWEISIKSAIGKLEIPKNYIGILKEQGFFELPVLWEHADKARHLPFHHTDPFDRMLVAQAMIDGLTILTIDKTIPQYKVQIL